MNLTKDEKAQAIQLAMDLELENYNEYAINGVLLTFEEEEREALFNFWKECCPLTQKAYLECCMFLKHQPKQNKIREFLEWCVVGLACIGGLAIFYLVLVLACACEGV